MSFNIFDSLKIIQTLSPPLPPHLSLSLALLFSLVSMETSSLCAPTSWGCARVEAQFKKVWIGRKKNSSRPICSTPFFLFQNASYSQVVQDSTWPLAQTLVQNPKIKSKTCSHMHISWSVSFQMNTHNWVNRDPVCDCTPGWWRSTAWSITFWNLWSLGFYFHGD